MDGAPSPGHASGSAPYLLNRCGRPLEGDLCAHHAPPDTVLWSSTRTTPTTSRMPRRTQVSGTAEQSNMRSLKRAIDVLEVLDNSRNSPLVTAEGGEVTNEGLPVRGRCGDQGADRVGQFGELAVGQAGEGSRHQARSSSMVQPGSSVGLSPRKPREPPNLRVRRRAASTNQCVGKVWARRCRTSQQGPKCRGNQRASEGNLAETEGFEPGPHAEARGRSVAFPLICRGSKLCSWRFRSNRRGSGLRGSYARASLRAAVTVSYA